MKNIYLSGTFMMSLLFLIESKKRKPKRQAVTVQNNDTLEYVFIGSFAVLLLVVLVYLLNKREKMLRSQKLRNIKRVLQVKETTRKNRPCTMTQMQKDEAIAWFLKQNWILEQSSGKDHSLTIPLKIINLKRKQIPVDGSKYLKDYYDAFYVQMKGSSSMYFGVIMFEKYYMTILFDKSTSSSKNSSGTYDYKLFDGSLKKGNFQGKWYLTNDSKIEAERESLIEKEREKNLDETASEKSFSKFEKQSDDLSSLSSNHKKTKGTFKLYHA